MIIKEMPCNCSNTYCFDKVPEESIVKIGNEPVAITIVDQYGMNKKTITWDEWIALADNLRYDKYGKEWIPYVGKNKKQ